MYLSNEIVKAVSNNVSHSHSLDYEDSIFKMQADDISKQITDKTERQIIAIEEIAKSATAIADNAKKESEQAQLDSLSAKSKSDKSFKLALCTLGFTILINADQIISNLLKLIDNLGSLLNLIK